MIFRCSERTIYEKNIDVLELFGIKTKHGSTKCFFDYPGHEGDYAIWFNYRCFVSGGKKINPSSSKYINIYSNNDEDIAQEVPEGKNFKNKSSTKIIVFVKDKKDCIYFSGVYVCNKIDKMKRIEYFKRISTIFNTENVYYIQPTDYYSKTVSKKLNSISEEKIVDLEDEKEENNLNNEITNKSDIKYHKNYKPVIKIRITNGSKVYVRHTEVAENALYNSKMKCEYNNKHKLFTKKNGKKYLEVHHLIPMAEQGKFKVSIDMEENVVCLCPNCHREIHFGKNREKMIEKLLNDRATLLKKSGIQIELNELINMYN